MNWSFGQHREDESTVSHKDIRSTAQDMQVFHSPRFSSKHRRRVFRRRCLCFLGWLVVGLLVVALAAPIWIYLRLSRMGESLRDAVEEMQSATERISESFATETTHAQMVTVGDLKFDAFFVTHGGPPLAFFFLNEEGERFANFDRLRHYLHTKGKRLRFSTNAGIFLQVAAPSGFLPEGLFVQEGREIVPLNNRKGAGNFYLEPNGVFAVTRDGYAIVDTATYSQLTEVVHATQSGPLLVHKGKINPRFSSRSDKLNIRSGVGVINPETAVFVISREPVTFYQFARVFVKFLRCKNALYLDGAISQMYLPELGRYDSGGDFAGLIALSEDENTP
jgi:uncharacterized protein YigE (DUF2233 family)